MRPVLVCFILSAFMAGCGYSTSAVSGRVKTIYVEPFRNKIAYDSETTRKIYIPLMEVKITNAVVDRFLFDGHLKIAKENKADAILQGELIDYQRDALRYTDNEDVQEYRITISVSLKLFDPVKQEVIWSEPNFSGDTTYFVVGAQAKSESAAIEDALKDLGRRVVERTIENW